ncbi:MAG: type II secretion system F family protein [Eubacteriales bacterium]
MRRVNARLSTARYASALSMMLASGYPVEDAMRSFCANGRYGRETQTAATERAREHLLSGGDFADAAEKSGLFEPMHEKMIRFGTAAGKIDAVMEKLSGIYMNESGRRDPQRGSGDDRADAGSGAFHRDRRPCSLRCRRWQCPSSPG